MMKQRRVKIKFLIFYLVDNFWHLCKIYKVHMFNLIEKWRVELATKEQSLDMIGVSLW